MRTIELVTDNESRPPVTTSAVILCERCEAELTLQTQSMWKVHHSYGRCVLTIIVEPCQECIRRAVKEAELRTAMQPKRHVDAKGR